MADTAQQWRELFSKYDIPDTVETPVLGEPVPMPDLETAPAKDSSEGLFAEPIPMPGGSAPTTAATVAATDPTLGSTLNEGLTTVVEAGARGMVGSVSAPLQGIPEMIGPGGVPDAMKPHIENLRTWNQKTPEEKNAIRMQWRDPNGPLARDPETFRRLNEIAARIERGELDPAQVEAKEFPTVDPRETPMARAGAALERRRQEEFQTPESFRGGMTEKLAEAGGGMIGQFGAAALGGAVAGPAGATAVAAGQGVGMGAEEGASRARAAGASPEDVQAAAQRGGLIGSSELLPVETFLGMIPGVRGAGMVAGIIQQAGVEGVQEAMSQYAQNQSARQYDPNQNPWEGVGEALGIGAILGGGAGAVSGVTEAPQAPAQERVNEAVPAPAPTPVQNQPQALPAPAIQLGDQSIPAPEEAPEVARARLERARVQAEPATPSAPVTQINPSVEAPGLAKAPPPVVSTPEAALEVPRPPAVEARPVLAGGQAGAPAIPGEGAQTRAPSPETSPRNLDRISREDYVTLRGAGWGARDIHNMPPAMVSDSVVQAREEFGLQQVQITPQIQQELSLLDQIQSNRAAQAPQGPVQTQTAPAAAALPPMRGNAPTGSAEPPRGVAQVKLPVMDNDGNDLTPVHTRLRAELERLGPVTVSEASGDWREKESGQVFSEPVREYNIDAPQTPETQAALRQIAYKYGRETGQYAMYVRDPDDSVDIVTSNKDDVDLTPVRKNYEARASLPSASTHNGALQQELLERFDGLTRRPSGNTMEFDVAFEPNRKNLKDFEAIVQKHGGQIVRTREADEVVVFAQKVIDAYEADYAALRSQLDAGDTAGRRAAASPTTDRPAGALGDDAGRPDAAREGGPQPVAPEAFDEARQEVREGGPGQAQAAVRAPKRSPEQVRQLTAVPILYGDERPEIEKGKRKTVGTVAKVLMTRSMERLRSLGINSGQILSSNPEVDELLTEAITQEAEAAFQQRQGDTSAHDWYTEKIEEAIRVASVMYPEISTDPNARAAFTSALAITSQGEKVTANVKLADQAYSQFRRTGRFPTDIKAKQGLSMNSNFAKLNEMIEQRGLDGMTKFLSTQYTVKELKDAGWNIASENSGERVWGSIILGAKIGNGFYQNLNGNYDPVTFDLWWMRMWGRLTGTLMGGSDEKMGKQKDRLLAAMKAEGINLQEGQTLSNFAFEAVARHEKDFKINRAQYDSKEKRPSELTLAAKNYLQGAFGINEVPTSGGQRAWMRRLVNVARQRLAERGIHLTNADIQAILWYPEKDLYGLLSGKPAKALNQDYAGALSDYAREKGYDEGEIAQARLGPVARGPGRPERDVHVEGEDQGRSGQDEDSGRAPTTDTEGSRASQNKETARRTRGEVDSGTGEVFFATLPPAERKRASAEHAKRVYEGGLSEGAKARSADLGRALTSAARDAKAIADRITGNRIAFRVGTSVPDLPGMKGALEASGAPGGTARGAFTVVDGNPIIYLATTPHTADPSLMRSTAAHEAWHFLRNVGFVDEKSVKLLAREHDRLKSFIAQSWDKDFAASLSPDEVEAHAFEAYWGAAEDNAPIKGLHIGIRRGFDRIRNFLNKVRNLVNGMGFQTVEDVFERARTGEASQGLPRGPKTALAARSPGRRSHVGVDPQRSFEYDSNPGRFRQWLAYNVSRNIAANLGTDFNRKYIDSMADWAKVQTALNTQNRRVTDALDVYVAEANASGRIGSSLRDLRREHQDPILDDLRKAKISAEDFGDFLLARHAEERNREGRRIGSTNPKFSGMSDSEARAILDGRRNDGTYGTFEALAKKVDALNEQTHKLMVKSGLISQATFNDIRSKYAHFVPVADIEVAFDDLGLPTNTGSGFSLPKREIQPFKGVTGRAANPFVLSLVQAQETIVRAEKNRVLNTLVRMVQANPNKELWEIVRPQVRERINAKTGLIEKYTESPAQQQFFNGRIFVAKVGGVPTQVIINHDGLAEGLSATGPTHMGMILKAMQKVTSFMRATVTLYSPEFVLVNLLRDIQTAFVHAGDVPENVRKGIRRKMIKDLPGAVRGLFRDARAKPGTTNWQRWAEEFRRNGGKIDFYGIEDVNQKLASMQKDLDTGKKAALRRYARGLMDAVDASTGALENASRLVLYKNLVEAGLSKQKAAYAARDLTVNFDKKGTYGGALNAAYMFYNASIGGTYRMLRSLSKSKSTRAYIGAMAATGFMMSFLNYMLAGEDDDGENIWDKVPHYLKERNFILTVGKNIYMFPMPLGYNVFHNIGDSLADIARRQIGWGTGQTPLEGAGSVLGAAAAVLAPIQGGDWSPAGAVKLISPTAFDPLISIASNEDDFGQPIWTRDGEGPDAYQFKNATPDWLKRAAQVLNEKTGGDDVVSGTVDLRPETFYLVYQELTGGIGNFVEKAGTSIKDVLHDKDVDYSPKIPFAGRFYQQFEASHNASDYYNIKDGVQPVVDAAEKYERAGNADKLRRLKEQYPVEFKVWEKFKEVDGALRKLGGAEKDVRTDWDRPYNSRLNAVEGIEKKRQRLMLDARREYYRELHRQLGTE